MEKIYGYVDHRDNVTYFDKNNNRLRWFNHGGVISRIYLKPYIDKFYNVNIKVGRYTTDEFSDIISTEKHQIVFGGKYVEIVNELEEGNFIQISDKYTVIYK